MGSILSFRLATLITLIVVSLDVIRRFVRGRTERKGYPLPPGPTSFPFIGSAFSINPQEPFRTYTEWQQKYGDIMYTKLWGVDMVILNSPTAAVDLLEKRSEIYSDRPFMPTIDLYGLNYDFGFMPYGDHWRLCRRIFHQTFRADNIVNFYPIHLRKARQLILNMANDPAAYSSHYSTFSAAISMCSVYDYDPITEGDPMVSIINTFVEASFPQVTPEKTALFKTFPFLPHIPDWLPGSSIKHEARMAREMAFKMVEEPYKYVQRRKESKEDHYSMVSNHISLMEKYDDPYHSQYELALKSASSTAYTVTVETTSSTLLVFTLAMIKYPKVQKRAQADIDSIVGINRLPQFDDRPALPYIEAIVRETMRWEPSVPLGVAHATTTSDIYNGLYIPKGATIVANIWSMSRDETRYPNAGEFTPERFLDAKGNLTDDVLNFVFGFGRRICPGRHAATASLWIAIVTMLATLDFNFSQDADGRDIDFEPEFMNGITRHPLNFPCCITPRSHVNKELLNQILN